MKLLQLRIFRDIAYHKSFVKAAQVNNITQPAVSAQLKALEEELNVKLLNRVPRKVSLTPEGRVYLSHIEDILLRCDNLYALSEVIKGSPKGEVRVASIPSIGMYELGPFLRSFMYLYPQVKVNLQYQDVQQVYELVKSKKIDLGMVAYPEKRSSFEQTYFAKDKLALIVPPHHPFANLTSIDIKEINGEKFIAFDSNTPTRNSIDKYLKSKNITVDIKISNNNIFSLKKGVEAGLGISIVPWKTVDEEVRSGTIKRISINKMNLSRPLAIITLKKQHRSNISELFINSLVNHHRMEDKA